MFGDRWSQPMALIVYFFTLSCLNGLAPPETMVSLAKIVKVINVKSGLLGTENVKGYLFSVKVNLEIGGDLD